MFDTYSFIKILNQILPSIYRPLKIFLSIGILKLLYYVKTMQSLHIYNVVCMVTSTIMFNNRELTSYTPCPNTKLAIVWECTLLIISAATWLMTPRRHGKYLCKQSGKAILEMKGKSVHLAANTWLIRCLNLPDILGWMV